MLKKPKYLGLLLLIGLCPSYIFAATEDAMMITNRHHPEAFIQSIQNDPSAGKKIYEQFCSTCHAQNPRISVGAPRMRVPSDWELCTKKGLDGLLAVTKVGINQMPPRGGCFECSDSQLKAAIIFMLPSTKKNK